MMTKRIIRFGRDKKNMGIEAKIGLCTSHIYDLGNPRSARYDPTFPKRVALSARAVGFFEDEIDEWLARRNQADGGGREQQFQALQEGCRRFRENLKAGTRLLRPRRHIATREG